MEKRERNEQIGQNVEAKVTGDVFDESELGLNFTVKQDRVLVEFFGSTDTGSAWVLW